MLPLRLTYGNEGFKEIKDFLQVPVPVPGKKV